MNKVTWVLAVLLLLTPWALVDADSTKPVALITTESVNRYPPRPVPYLSIWAPIFGEVDPLYARSDVTAQRLFLELSLNRPVDLVFDTVANLRDYAHRGLLKALGSVDEAIAEWRVAREHLIIINGEVFGLQVLDKRGILFTPLGYEFSRWGVAWVERSTRDAEVRQILSMAADLLRTANPPDDDRNYQAIHRFLEYLLLIRDLESAMFYVYPPFRDDPKMHDYYRNRLYNVAFTSQLAERRPIWFRLFTPYGKGNGIEHLASWYHPVDQQEYQDVTWWMADVTTARSTVHAVPVYIIEHEGEWYILHVGDVI